MADKKVTALSDIGTTIASADLLHVIDDVAGTPVNKKMEIGKLFQNIPSTVALGGTPQNVTGSTDVNATTSVTTLTLGGVGGDVTGAMANGTNDGQLKIITVVTAHTTHKYTLTPTSTNFNGFNSITFGKLGDSVLLIWANSKWNIIGRQGATETPDALTAAGAVSLTSPVTFVSSSGAAYDITLGHGIEGQMKTITMTAHGGSSYHVELSKANGNLGTSVGNKIQWNTAGDSATLVYTGSVWELASTPTASVT